MTENLFNSPRLYFRKWTEKDLNYALELWGDPKVSQYIDTRKQLSYQDVLAKLNFEINQEKRNGIQYWPIFLNRGNIFIGCCGLRPYKDGLSFELGVHICSEHWNNGYALEAANKVIRYAFDTLTIEKLFAGHHPFNTVSEIILEKLGFVYSHDEYYKDTGLMHPSYFLER